MAKDSETMTLCDFGGGTMERRTAKSGKQRYTVTIHSKPLVFETSPKALGIGPAQAIADHLKQRTADISETASEATMKARLSAQKAVMAGQSWAMRRYSGGRIGTRAPARSDRLFNDSGRLIESIAVGAKDDGYVINVAGNRFNPDTLNGGEAALLRIIERLRELAPEWGDARLLMDSLPVQRAIRDGLKDAIQKANARGAAIKQQMMGQAVSAAIRVLRAVG